jgi:hypothetical protein
MWFKSAYPGSETTPRKQTRVFERRCCLRHFSKNLRSCKQALFVFDFTILPSIIYLSTSERSPWLFIPVSTFASTFASSFASLWAANVPFEPLGRFPQRQKTSQTPLNTWSKLGVTLLLLLLLLLVLLLPLAQRRPKNH